MTTALPAFRYHPFPLQTGAVMPSTEACVCCGQSRGFVYTASVYGSSELRGKLCPWCIADGSAARRFDLFFSDDHPLLKSGVPKKIVDEVTRRTPGYISWQQEEWLSHCGDACEFHGDATPTDLSAATPDSKRAVLDAYRLTEDQWSEITSGYEPGGDPAIYKFVCRHCAQVRFGWDCS
jgi:uncharacterized protein